MDTPLSQYYLSILTVLVVLCMIALELGVGFGALSTVGVLGPKCEVVVAVASVGKIGLACIKVDGVVVGWEHVLG